MTASACSHLAARDHLAAGEHESALRVTGAMLEADPSDLAAWRLAAMAMAGLGRTDEAVKNLKSAALALAEQQNPILAIAVARQVAALGGEEDGPLGKIATLYGAGSSRVVDDLPLAPPPLPMGLGVAPWGAKTDLERLPARAADVMAVAWGAALTQAENAAPLPYVPLFGALESRDFVELARCLEPLTMEPGDLVVEQGAAGDAMYIVAEGTVSVSRLGADGECRLLAQLGPGAFFGEMALVSRAPRAAEVRAAGRVVLLRGDRENMEQLARRIPAVGDVLIAFCHARMLENLMRVSPVLAPVPPAKRPDVIARFGTDYRNAGAAIVEEGGAVPGLFLVVSGAVRVTRREGGETLVVAQLGPGDLFGEISLLMQKPATATVTAVENTALLMLSREDFNDVTRDFPELLKGAYDIAMSREAQNNSIMAAPAIDLDDIPMV
jgi:cAMP-dependent protein kinase regulator